MPEVTYLEAINQGLAEELERDADVFLMGEDIASYGGAFKVTRGLAARFGADRVMDTPLCESGFVGAAIGAAMMGLRPVVELQFIDFISCAWNQIVNMAAKAHYRWGARVPLVLRGPCGGGVSGGPFHSQNPEAWFFHVPGLKVVCPATPADARGLLKSAVRDDNPVIYLEHKFLYRRIRGELPEGDGAVPLGQARVVRSGRDVTLVTYGSAVHVALEAAESLSGEGIEAEVLDLRSLVPMDLETVLESVSRTSRAVVVHEDTLRGGIGGEVAAQLADRAFEYLDAPVRRVASLDLPVPYSPPLEQAFMPSKEKVADAVRHVVAF